MRIRSSLLFKLFVFSISVLLFFYSAFMIVSLYSADHIPSQAGQEWNLYPPNNMSNREFSLKGNEMPLSPQAKEIDHPQEFQDKLIEFNSRKNQHLSIPIFSFFVILISFIYLTLSLGWQKSQDHPAFYIIHKLPIDLLLIVFALLCYSISLISQELFADEIPVFLSSFPNLQLLAATLYTIIFIALYGFVLVFTAQIKVDTLWQSSLFYKLLLFLQKQLLKLWQLLKKLYLSCSLYTKQIILVILFLSLNFFLIRQIITQENKRYLYIIGFVLFNIIYFIINVRYIKSFEIIKKSIILINKGNFDEIKVTDVNENFAEVADSISELNQNIKRAIEEKTRSEQFKTELITNVSHDIKTPLTSIIMFTDLLAREKTENENIKEYVAILEKQSARLKNLIEDLIEASKISTGNIQVQLTSLNLNEFLNQIYAEYEEKFNRQNLKLIFTLPENPVFVKADAKAFFRVIDNLLNNILKYALPDSRVYLDVLTLKKENIQIRLRNVSAEPLNISAEQLMERFVQGDLSRNSGGSGIGLSIAKSLMEAQNGSLSIKIDGDLFTVYLSIPKSFILDK